jgi:hypothetical protein
MARNEDVSCANGDWTQLTNGDVSAIRVHTSSVNQVILQASNGTTEPASDAGSLPLAAGSTLAADLTLAQLWPGISGANRLWAKPIGGDVLLSVSHA